jgi:hypothetical protein
MNAADAQQKVGQLPLLEGLADDVRSQVGSALVEVSDMYRYADNEILIHAGYLSFDTGFALIEGGVEIDSVDGQNIAISSPALLGEMSQFKAGDRRSATVRAKGVCIALQFSWADLYTHAEEVMPADTIRVFKEAVEIQVWERFQYKNLVDLGMLVGLHDDLKQKVCRPFPSITERQHLQGVDILFNEGGRCQTTGYLLVEGSIKLFRKNQNEMIVQSPNIIGIFPGKGEEGTEWSATAMPNGEAELLQFSWQQYSDELVAHLTREEQQDFVGSIKTNAKKHFWH